jgi:uncharacterized protein
MNEKDIIQQYLDHVGSAEYPCIAARAATARDQIKCFVARHMGCPADDRAILDFLYGFVSDYKRSKKQFHSAAVIFKAPAIENEMSFETLFWQRLNALSYLDNQTYTCDPRVDADPSSPHFSYSLKEEAFFVIGLHPASSRPARRFAYPVLVFNPHAQFETLRNEGQYERMKRIVRKRDMAYAGSINPMLSDFGEVSEVFQYTGMQYSADWKCPLINHTKKDEQNSPS